MFLLKQTTLPSALSIVHGYLGLTIDYRLRIFIDLSVQGHNRNTPCAELALLTATAAPLNQRPHKHKAAAIQMGGGS